MLATLFTASLLVKVTSFEPESLHPALRVTSESFEKIWSKALSDGQKKRSKTSGLDKMRRQIDSYHVSMVAKEACSWVFWLHPRALIQIAANEAGQKYLPEDEIARRKAELSNYADNELTYLGFYFDLSSMPSFAGGYGTISRYASRSKLENVRVVLKVGDRIIQPLKQPGDITTSREDQIGFFSIPVTTYVSGKTSSSASVYGSDGSYASGNVYTRSSYQISSYETGSESYQVYKGQTTVLFPTRDKTGRPLITPKDKNIEVKLISDEGEIKTAYSLGDWVKALE